MVQVFENYSDFDAEEISLACRRRFGEESVIDQLTTIYREVGGQHLLADLNRAA
jgi:hypothetical protein